MVISTEQGEIVEQMCENVRQWLNEEGQARSTLAGAVVLIDKLSEQVPFTQDDIFTDSGQLAGGRDAALRDSLARYGERRQLLKDGVTTRSLRKFEKLADRLNWGEDLVDWHSETRQEATLKIVAVVMTEIDAWFERQHISLPLDQAESPVAWIEHLIELAKSRSQGRVEQHLVGAKLKQRMPQKEVSVHAAFAADVQTQRAGDFVVGQIVFHVTAAPAPPVIEKCRDNLRQGLHPVLVIPRKSVERAKGLASAYTRLDSRISFVAIEDFVAANIIELAGEEGAPLIDVFKSILEIYNERIEESESDLSLRIDLG